MYRRSKSSQRSSIILPVRLNETKLLLVRLLFVLSNKFLNIQATIDSLFTLKRLHDMITTYPEMHHTDRCSQHSSIIWPVWLNGWVVVYELSGWGFESCCSHLNFRYRTCSEQGVPWQSGSYRVWINSETCTWHDNNIR